MFQKCKIFQKIPIGSGCGPKFLHFLTYEIYYISLNHPKTRPFEKLVAKRPSASLISGPNMVSLFLQIFLSMGIQTGVYFYLASRPWYEPLHPSSPTEEIIKCWETTSIFCVSSFQYLLLAVIFRLVPILLFCFKHFFSFGKYHRNVLLINDNGFHTNLRHEI